MTYWNTRHEPIVYYMAHKDFDGAIKIGTTVNETTRIYRFCRNRLSDSFFILAREPGDARLEAQRHRQFREYLVTSDWFFQTGKLSDHIEALIEIDFQPLASEPRK